MHFFKLPDGKMINLDKIVRIGKAKKNCERTFFPVFFVGDEDYSFSLDEGEMQLLEEYLEYLNTSR